MIIKTSNILDSDCTGLVVPVNTKGVAGAGLAKAWKQKFCSAYQEYRAICNQDIITPGSVKVLTASEPHIMVFTKDHWSNPSKLEWIETALIQLWVTIQDNTQSIKLPKIGCGLGGLDWDTEVFPMVKRYLVEFENLEVYI